jgi:glycosyltransferase involved in cell wall biosynthesis
MPRNVETEQIEQVRRWRIAHSEFSTGWGGQERRIMAELGGFQKRGHQVWLIAPPQSQIYRQAQAAGIPAVPFQPGKIYFPFEAVRLARWLRRNQIQILNTHSSRDGWLLGIAGRLARVPFIVRTRHFDVPVANRWLSGFVFRKLADHILTTSPKVTEHFKNYFQLPDDRVSTLATGVDTKQFSPDGEAAELVPAAQSKNLPLIGIVSIIRLAKGHATLMEAARILTDGGLAAHYVIVGEGPSRAPVENKIRELRLEDCVTFTGQREDIPAVLRALKILVIPSLHEGIPQVGLQALACKTPVVGSNAGGIPEIIRDGETGIIFPAQDAHALASAIRETLASPDKTRARCECGRALVEARHGLDTMLDKLDALYRRHIPQAV